MGRSPGSSAPGAGSGVTKMGAAAAAGTGTAPSNENGNNASNRAKSGFFTRWMDRFQGVGCRRASYNARPMNAAVQTVENPLRVKFCGLDLNSPIVLLSGCVGFGEEYTRVEGFSNRDVGAIVLKGTTGSARLGNRPHRVYETPSGMLNAIGLQNPGAEHVVRRILPTLDFSETRFFANVSGSTIEEYAEVTRRFDDSPIDAIEINISCPNVKEGGVAFGNYPDMSAKVVEACRKATRKPIITKLSPNQTDIRENARRCIEAGSDGLAVINTIMGMAIDVKSRRPVIGNIQGGLSGPAIKPIALLKVHQVYEVARRHNVPIIGQGGIATPQDALEFMIAGATTVGLGTALFYDPLLCRKINAGVADYLEANQLGLSQLVGSLRTD
jgi:dihydroorotate dehydrogenase (NAD+) catalytic subunit